MTVALNAIRECFEGALPAIIATASEDGTPNVAYSSQVQFIDDEHVALSYQFFNKTHKNILVNPRAALIVIHPGTVQQYRLALHYLHTETAGPLFEGMKAKLAGIASQTGMAGVFRLLGADRFRVLTVEAIEGETLPPRVPRCNLLAALRGWSARVAGCPDLERLLADTLTHLDRYFCIHHAMLLMLDGAQERLYTVASIGYPDSGVGSEIALGDGVIGVAARERAPIRIGHMSSEYSYSRAIRANTAGSEWAGALETEIPFPGLAEARSQMAVPVMAARRLLGVLYVESPRDLDFSYDDEDALVTLTGQLGMAIHMLQAAAENGDADGLHDDGDAAQACGAPQLPVVVRHYPENDSVFLNADYLIKGVAGAIIWTMLQDYTKRKLSEFTNRELRLDPRIRLPDVSDNLEARLILLSKRLVERDAPIRIEKTGRGRIRLRVLQPIELMEAAR
jgi:adenylate cyclase